MKSVVSLLALVATSSAFAQFGLIPAGNASNVQFYPLMQGNDLTTNTPGVYVFNEPNAFASYWANNHRGAGPALQSDFFQKWRILAIHLGNRPAGSSLGITGIVRRIGLATVNAVEIVPSARRRDSSREDRSDRRPRPDVSPWLLLRVERGAFDFALSTRQVQGYGSGVSDGPSGSNGPRKVHLGNGITGYFPN